MPDKAPEESELTGPRWVAALDVGGMSVKYGAVNSAGAVAATGQLPLDHTGPAAHLLEVLGQAASYAIDGAERQPECVSVAFPAPFDYDAGMPLLRHKFNSLFGLDLGDELRRRLDLSMPVTFCNDAVAAGLGEAEFGQARTAQRIMMITLGTGLGACLIEGGVAVTGQKADAIPELYRQHTPGGLADDVFSARGIATRLGCATSQLKRRVAAAVSSPKDQRLLAEFGSDLGLFLAPHIRGTQAQALIVGGGAAGAIGWFGDSLRESAQCPVHPASLGSSAALLGVLVHSLGSSVG